MTSLSTISSDTCTLLDWCCESPHTVDQIIGLHAESSERMRWDHGIGNQQMLDALDAAADAGRGHADPTSGGGGARSMDPDDPTVAAIKVAVEMIYRSAERVDQLCAADRGYSAAWFGANHLKADSLHAASAWIRRSIPHLEDLALDTTERKKRRAESESSVSHAVTPAVTHAPVTSAPLPLPTTDSQDNSNRGLGRDRHAVTPVEAIRSQERGSPGAGRAARLALVAGAQPNPATGDDVAPGPSGASGEAS